MSATAQPIRRLFKFGVRNLPDPGSHLSPAEVKAFYSGNFPELLTANIDGPHIEGATATYTFERAYGTKGITPEQEVTAAPTARDVIDRALAPDSPGSLFDERFVDAEALLPAQHFELLFNRSGRSVAWRGSCAPMPF